MPHTLIKLKDPTLLLTADPLPVWTEKMLNLTSYVIVRRGEQQDRIPVGIRGFQKSQRFGTWIDPDNWLAAVTPQQALQYLPKLSSTRRQLKPFQTLDAITPLLKTYDWGVGGSLAYELVTGIEMARPDSDVDVIMTLPKQQMTPHEAQHLIADLRTIMGAHADIQMVQGQYGFSLEEYAAQRTTEILVKTNAGPILSQDPWQLMTEMDD